MNNNVIGRWVMWQLQVPRQQIKKYLNYVIMKKKISAIVVLSVIILSIGVVLNLKSSNYVHSHEDHENCTELAQVKAGGINCPNCFRAYDDYGHCPLCDYLDCPNCGNHYLCIIDNICHHCGEWNPIMACKKCGLSYIECNCDEPEF